MADQNTSAVLDQKKQRFAQIDSKEHERILKAKDAINTQKATDSSLRTFMSYLEEKGIDDKQFETWPKSQLDEVLSKFYLEARQENGQLYKKSSLFSIRHGINRHLQQFQIDIINDPEFKESNTTFCANVKELKRQGQGGVDHYPPIEKEDLLKLYNYFDLDNNIKLQEKVFFDVVLYFGRRGRENIHTLKISDFAATTDTAGSVYIFLVHDELTKNHQEDSNTSDGRMFSIPDDEMCPVKSFMKYKRALNPKCNRLFQRPSRNPTSLQWYDAIPMGHNSIGDMMPKMSESAGLSKRYTNHSLRATAVHLLDSTGRFSSRHIMSVTGHKSESSLKTYTGYTSTHIKKSMSNALSENLRSNLPVSGSPPRKTVRLNNHSDVVQNDNIDIDVNQVTFEALSNSQEDKLLLEFADNSFVNDDIFKDILLLGNTENIQPHSSVNPSHIPAVNKMQNVISSISTYQNQQTLPYPVIRNCSNITINYNFGK